MMDDPTKYEPMKPIAPPVSRNDCPLCRGSGLRVISYALSRDLRIGECLPVVLRCPACT